MDTALLLIRLVVGLTVTAHGVQKLFGALGGEGVGETATLLESLGFRPGRPHALLLGVSEVIGGLLFALGLVTPLAAAAIAGSMVGAVALHWDKGYFALEGGFEYPFVLAVTALAAAFSGPGRFSVDHVIGWDFAGEAWGLAATALAVVSYAIIGVFRSVSNARADQRRPRAA